MSLVSNWPFGGELSEHSCMGSLCCLQQASSPMAAQYNPGESFATDCGQDFLANHSPSAIDFAATHIWVDNWQVNSSFCGATSNPR